MRKFLPVFLIQYLIRVRRIDIIAGCLGKSEIARLGKVPDPCKVIDAIGKF